jgi:broad specificity phosphatase PhoE
MGMPKNLLLVRHGQSEGNLVRKKFEETNNESFFSDEFLGLHESQYQLTKLGIAQAKKAGQCLLTKKFIAFDRMLVSNNVRAMQTAAYLNLKKSNWMMDFNLRERDGGLFNQITPSKRDSHYADQKKFYNSQPFLFRPPQGESIADLCQRIKIVLDTLARECDGKNVIIVCHGHVIRAFRIILERMSLQKSNNLLLGKQAWARVPNCSILHYTREDPFNHNQELSDRFNWVRMLRPSGGGKREDNFLKIVRKKYSNRELLSEALKNRNTKCI